MQLSLPRNNDMVKNTIAFVIYSLSSGGAERVVSILANELSKKYTVVIITFKKVSPFYPLSPDVKLFHCVDFVPPSKNISQALRSNYILLKAIKTYLKREKVNLVIGFLTSANVLSVLAAKIRNIPVIICERNNPFITRLPLFWRILKKVTYPKATFLIVQTEKIKSYYKVSIDASKLKILPNPIAPSLTLTRNPNALRERVILNVGRLNPQKAQDALIKAFAAIKHSGWKLHIVGRGLKEEEYRKLISALNLEETVELLPPTKQIHDHYNTASIFAFTSLFEGFPNALIEAMHFGMACVSTDCPTGPSELIEHGVNGFLIPVNDQEELEKHLQRLVDDEELRNRFGEQARESVERFESEEILGSWKMLIAEVLLKRMSFNKKTFDL